MYILFAISVLCFFVLALAAITIARHVRSSRTSTHRQRDSAQHLHLFAAAADQDSRRPRPITQQSVKEVLAKMRYQAPSSSGQHRQPINLLKALLARKDLLYAIRCPLPIGPHQPFWIASGFPRRQDPPRRRRDRLRSRLRPHLAPASLHACASYAAELRRPPRRHGSRPRRRLLRNGSSTSPKAPWACRSSPRTLPAASHICSVLTAVFSFPTRWPQLLPAGLCVPCCL